MRNPQGMDHLMNDNPRYQQITADQRLSMGSVATVSTVNTRASSVLPAAQHNLGKTESVLGAYDAEAMQNVYIHSNIGAVNKKNFENVPMNAKDALDLNQKLLIEQTRKAKQEISWKRKLKKGKRFSAVFLIISLIVGATMAVVMGIGGGDSSSQGESITPTSEDDETVPTGEPTDKPTSSPTLSTINRETNSPTTSPVARPTEVIPSTEIVDIVVATESLDNLCAASKGTFAACTGTALGPGREFFICINGVLDTIECSLEESTGFDICSCEEGKLVELSSDLESCIFDLPAFCPPLEQLSFTEFETNEVITIPLTNDLPFANMLNKCNEGPDCEEFEVGGETIEASCQSSVTGFNLDFLFCSSGCCDGSTLT